MKQINEYMEIKQYNIDTNEIIRKFDDVEDFLACCYSDDIDITVSLDNEIIDIKTDLIIKLQFNIVEDAFIYFIGYIQAKIDNGYEPKNPIFNFMKTK